MTAGEIHDMSEADRYTTAMIRARFYRKQNEQSGQQHGGP